TPLLIVDTLDVLIETGEVTFDFSLDLIYTAHTGDIILACLISFRSTCKTSLVQFVSFGVQSCYDSLDLFRVGLVRVLRHFCKPVDCISKRLSTCSYLDKSHISIYFFTKFCREISSSHSSSVVTITLTGSTLGLSGCYSSLSSSGLIDFMDSFIVRHKRLASLRIDSLMHRPDFVCVVDIT